MAAAIVDAGPLIAFLDEGERHHAWVVEQIGMLEPPLLTCESVLSEAWHLLGRRPAAQDMVFELVEDGTLSIAFRLDDEIAAVRRLSKKYRNVPMSVADACIVRMAEIYDRHLIFTLDTDFLVYRKHGRTPLTLIHPGSAQ